MEDHTTRRRLEARLEVLQVEYRARLAAGELRKALEVRRAQLAVLDRLEVILDQLEAALGVRRKN